MKYDLPCQKIEPRLIQFTLHKIRVNKIHIPLASKRILKELSHVCEEIVSEGIPHSFVLKKLKNKLGFGIFLHPRAKTIKKGAVIAPYSGQVLLAPQNYGESSDYAFSLISGLKLTKEQQSQFDGENRYHPRRLYSLDLDAAKIGNFTRFINHSEQPNVEALLLRIPKGSLPFSESLFEMIYVAKKQIQPGEQLLICYEGEDRSYWGPLGIRPFSMTPKTFQIDGALKLHASV